MRTTDTSGKQRRLTSDIGGGDARHILVRGLDLVDDLIDHHDFVDMLVLVALGRLPDARLRRFINNSLLTSVDHGLTPSAMAARLTLHGAPESMQGAVAAGLLGAGSRYLGTVEASAAFLQQAATGLDDLASRSDAEIAALADATVARCRSERRIIPGVGHPIHVHGDPRTERLFQIAREDGYYGGYCRLALQMAAALARATGRPIPLNATGCKAALLLELGLPPAFGKGLALIGRTAGLVAHLLEEREHPISQQLWDLAIADGRAHQPRDPGESA